jgi:hypothetical protein
MKPKEPVAVTKLEDISFYLTRIGKTSYNIKAIYR